MDVDSQGNIYTVDGYSRWPERYRIRTGGRVPTTGLPDQLIERVWPTLTVRYSYLFDLRN